MSFDHLTIDQGLSSNTIYAITEDADGFLWFGSRYGLNRYDGYEVKIYRADLSDSLSLHDNHVQALFCDQEGKIWAGLRDGGISILDPAEQVFRHNPFPEEIPIPWEDLSVETIFQDSRGNIWIGTLGTGVIRIHPKTSEYLHLWTGSEKPVHRLSSDFAFSFVEDLWGRIWIGTSGAEIDCYDLVTDRIHQVGYPEGSETNLSSYSKALHLGGDTLWIGTEGTGLHFFHLGEEQFLGHILPDHLVTDIARDSNDRMLVATDGDGLYMINADGTNLQHYTYSGNLRNSLNTKALYDIYIDRHRNIWIGTFNGGINVYKPRKVEFLTFLQSENRGDAPGFQSVLSLYEDKKKNIWIGTDGGGLLRFDLSRQDYASYQAQRDKLPSDVFTAIHQDSAGVLWLGTYAQGLIRFDPQTRRFRQHLHYPEYPDSLANNNVWAIAEADQGKLWVGTLGGGLDLFDPQNQTFTHHLPDPSQAGTISDPNIRSLLRDKAGNLWIGTEYGGLNKLRAGSSSFKVWKEIPGDPSSLQANTVLCLFIDSKGFLWVGTEGGGLHRMKRDESGFRNYSTREGLPSDVINAIEEDSIGRLWISTNAGLSVFERKKEAFTNFDKNDGLQSNQFNPNASLHSSTGEIFFGGISGINVFSPGQLSVNKTPPRVVFTDFKLFNESTPISRFRPERGEARGLNDNPTIVLTHTENVFTLDFSAIEFTNPAKNSLAYRLLGFEDDWRYVSDNHHSVTYTNLDHGKYTFEVKGANNYGIWSSEIRRLQLIVKPAFWETSWFRGLVILLLLSMLVLYVQYAKRKREEAHQRELMKTRQEMLRLRNERLAQEVREKNGRLSAALLQSAHKNQSLDELKSELSELMQQGQHEPQRRKELRSLIRKIDSEIESEDYWEQFQLNFDQVHRQFSKKLQDIHPQLSRNDIRLCCLIKISLTNKEIASIQNISLSGVEKSKYRLKKKLNLNKEEDLHKYILKLD